MITIEQIQKKLAEELRQSGLSQTEIAKRIHVKQPTIGQYLSGRAMPALDTFANLCEALDLNPIEILCLDKK